MERDFGSCPGCGARVPVRLAPGKLCADCRSAEAWSRYAKGRSKLIIDHEEIVAAEERRLGAMVHESRLAGWLRILPVWFAFGSGIVAVYLVIVLWSPFPLSPLAEFQREVESTASRATGFGGIAFLVGLFLTIRLRRSRHYRSWSRIVMSACSILFGGAGLVVGGVLWSAASSAGGWEYLEVPPRIESGGGTSAVTTVMEATCVIVAPGIDGDMSGMGVGSGAVVRSEPGRAWIVTCSHVAMPYVSVAAWREVENAHPVLVYFSDGRRVEGRVRWTTPPHLDVAVVVVDIADPPRPVVVSRDEQHIARDEAVFFLPNPLRDGWMVHHGRVETSRPIHTAIGEFQGIFTDLPVQPGDSGSGLFDSAGRLVGLNTWAHLYESGETRNGISLTSVALERIMRKIEAASPEDFRR